MLPQPAFTRPVAPLPLRRHLKACSTRPPPKFTAKSDSLGLPPTLRKYVDSFAAVPDPKMRYQQLLFFAKQLPPMDPSLKTDQNRVTGCTSVVHVNVSLDDNNLVKIEGDSDAQLTKGLLAMLVNGLNGTDPHNIADVNPDFISASGLAVSLTPSRNNGFVNMLAKIKLKVAQLIEQQSTQPQNPDRPMYSAIQSKLSALKPIRLHIEDLSKQHAGHAANDGKRTESHFLVSIVAEAFDSLTLVQRHRLVYTILAEEMEIIHALQIDAKTPQEVAQATPHSV